MRLIRFPHSVLPLVCVAVTIFAVSPPIHGQRVQAAAAGQPDSPEIKEFQTLEDQWSTAVVKADQYTMELLLSPLYVDISSGGDVTTRNQQIALLFEKTGSTPLSLEQKVASVREFGDTSVVSGTYIIKRKVNGEAREERGIFTHVYARARGKWTCVNSQRTTVVEQAANKSKPVQKSDAEQPFHIPFFHKGAESAQPPADPGSNPAAPH